MHTESKIRYVIQTKRIVYFLPEVRMECNRALEIADKRVAQVLKQREEEVACRHDRHREPVDRQFASRQEERMRKPRETLQETARLPRAVRVALAR